MNGNLQNSNDERNSSAESREIREISVWMQKFAARTPVPRNLPAPGLLLFKARLFEKQSATRRAVQPIFWMQVVSALIVIPALIYLQAKSQRSIGEILAEPFAALFSSAPLLFYALTGAVLICAALAYFLRGTEELKNEKR